MHISDSRKQSELLILDVSTFFGSIQNQVFFTQKGNLPGKTF